MKKMVVFEMPQGATLGDMGDYDYEPLKFQPCGTFAESSVGFAHTVFGSYSAPLSGASQIINIRTQKKSPKKAHIKAKLADTIKKLQ